MHRRFAMFFLVGCTAPTKESSNGATDSAAQESPDLVGFLTEPGPWTAGYRQITLRYESPDGERSLRLALWYPSDATEGERPQYGVIASQAALLDAPLADGTGWPTHVYSHGHQGYAEASSFWAEHLASHGFVVAAPDHTGNTTMDGSARETSIYYLRPLDIRAVIDQLEAPSGELGFLGGSLDMSLLTASGHSFGGYTLHALAGARYDATLLEECLNGTDTSSYCSTMDERAAARLSAGFHEPRIQAYVSMAPGDFRLFGSDGFDSIAAPILHFTGSLDPQTGGDSEAIWQALGGAPHARVDITGGGHLTFTDYSTILETADGLIDAPTGFRIVDGWGLAWLLQQTGIRDTSELLEGGVDIDPAARRIEAPAD